MMATYNERVIGAKGELMLVKKKGPGEVRLTYLLGQSKIGLGPLISLVDPLGGQLGRRHQRHLTTPEEGEILHHPDELHPGT